MFHIVLHEPEIPPNTGNIIRLTANLGATLHLLEPLGFSLEEKALRRAGLDYHALAHVQRHAGFEPWLLAHLNQTSSRKIYALSTRGTTRYDQVRFSPGDAFVFGSESRGLPESIREHPAICSVLYLPMRPNNRSLNLSNAVSILAMEAWRQQGFAGAER